MAESAALSVLIDAGLIAPVSDTSEPSLAFRHALIHDAAYASLLRAERRMLHRLVGESLESDFGAADPLDLAPRLGEHFLEAGERSRARRYFTLAGDAATRRHANPEAIGHFRRALEASSDDEDPESLRHLSLALGQALELSGRHPEALETYERLADAARRRAAPQLHLAALMARAKIHVTLTPVHDPQRVRGLLEEARAAARDGGDLATESQVLWNLMVLLTWSAEHYAEAIRYGLEAADLARRAESAERLAFALNDPSDPYVATRQFAAARRVLEESGALWRRLGNLPMLVDNLAQSAMVHYHFGELKSGSASAEEAVQLSEQIGNVWGQTNSRLYRSHLLLERGEIGRALHTIEEAIRLGEVSRHPGALIAARVDLGLLLGVLGEVEAAARWIDEASRLAEAQGMWLRPYPFAGQARIALLRGDLAEARTALSQARRHLRPEGLFWFAPMLIPLSEGELALSSRDLAAARAAFDELQTLATTMPARTFLAEALRGRARAAAADGDTQGALANLEKSRDACHAIGSRWRLLPVLADLATLRAQIQDASGAAEARREARAIVGLLLDGLPDESLRATFAQRPHVRALTTS